MVALAALVGALEAWVWYRRPPLLRGIAGTILFPGVANPNTVFNERVQSAFPKGLPEAVLVLELERQGFEESDGGGPSGHAVYITGLGEHWIISWQTDKADAVTKIQGWRRMVSL
jgi:hypothetical protein